MNQHTVPNAETPVSPDGPADFGPFGLSPAVLTAQVAELDTASELARAQSPYAVRTAIRHAAAAQRRQATAIARHRTAMAKLPRTSPRKAAAGTRPKGTRREHQPRAAKTSGGQDPGDDGDPDGDPAPLDAGARAAIAAAPRLSPEHASLLRGLLGGLR